MKKPIPFGKYYLLERINVGGMAEVFRAKAYGVEGFERLVAVKRILPNIAEDTDFIKMFIDEAKIAVQLNHANIAQIFDLGVVDSAYYIALEHVHGRDLRAIFDRCRNHGEPMPIAQACFVLMKVCEGLDYAHNKRDQGGRELHLVHRDVSPQNMLVSFEGEVKLIDFGIAKAAGKGTKTQAGILKGKFGYMSPEQVRGLPIDRRSDIFSCGIVLYELLTGERLFVGESDFSTLEKVRNVEILPPTTYNRKIPDELERIVLKALAKDVDDRYQNAIDLHDELQAFVYTAGEFYSRKDLAGWMKRTFAREIEEETAKLEQFRQLPPPQQVVAPAHTPAPHMMTPAPDRQRRATLSMGAAAAPPPPPTNGRAAAATAPQGGLEWDEDELETQIYDDQDAPVMDVPLSAPAPLPAAPHAPAMAAAGPSPARTLMGAGGLSTSTPPPSEPDLSSLVKSSAQWPAQADPTAAPPHVATQEMPQPAAPWANGSGQSPSPYPSDALGAESDPLGPPPRAEDPSAVVRLVNQGHVQPIYDSSFGDQFVPQQKSRGPLIAGIIAALLLLGGGGGLFWYFSRDDGKADEVASATTQPAGDPGGAELGGPPADEPPAEPPGDQPAADPGADPAVAPTAPPDMNTGFDVIVDPAGARVKLNGSDVGPAPRRIRNIAPGPHVIEIEAPGFFAKRHEVNVAKGTAETVRLTMDPIDIVGRFTSEPPGARVTLVSGGKREKLGDAPQTAKLDPRKRYEAVFKKPGYVTVTRPVEITGAPEVIVAVVLERADSGSVALLDDDDKKKTPPPPGDLGRKDPPKDPPKDTPKDPPKDEPVEDPVDTGGSKDPGILMLGSKPPCKIYIDGKDTGLLTPQREISLAPGTHKITLVNNEFGIKDSFTVKIKSGTTVRKIRDLSDQIK